MDLSKENADVVVEAKSKNINCNKNVQSTKCDKCHSPYAINPAKRKEVPGKIAHKPKFRKRLDPDTNKILTLCNKCGLSMSRIRKRPPKKPLPTQEDKIEYLSESEAFASSLAERLNEPDAKRLYCPHYKTEPCGCLQRYLKGKGNEDPSKMDERAMKLIELLKKAKHLRSEKVSPPQSTAPHSKGEKKPSQNSRVRSRHSVIFEEFVLSHRVSLREEIHLCERASQRILMYSNNFLHKELKSIKNQRIQRKTGKFVRGLLKPITELPLASCCNAKCVNLASSHPELLELWRNLAQRGQKDARRVLAEMLSCEEGSKTNCYKFISLVTGCSMNTISSVSKHMKSTSGSKEPPEHGLKRWWRENPKRRKVNSSVMKKIKGGKKPEGEIVDLESTSAQTASKPYEKSLHYRNSALSESSNSEEVTVMKAERLPTDSSQIKNLGEISKDIEVPVVGQNIHNENTESLNQIVEVSHSSHSVNLDLLPEKDAADCDTTVLPCDGQSVINVQSESLTSGQHMQILEVPLNESSSQTSVITSLAEKSHPQTSFGSASPQMEFPAVGVPLLVPYIVLLPGTVILDQSMS